MLPFITETGPLRPVVEVELDLKNYRKLKAFTDTLPGDVAALQVGIYGRDTHIPFAARAGRNSAVSRDGQGVRVPMRSIGSLVNQGAFTYHKATVAFMF